MTTSESNFESRIKNDTELRSKLIMAVALAASKVLKDEGIDTSDVRQNGENIDVSKLINASPDVKMDTLHDVANGVTVVATIVTATGF